MQRLNHSHIHYRLVWNSNAARLKDTAAYLEESFIYAEKKHRRQEKSLMTSNMQDSNVHDSFQYDRNITFLTC